MDRDLVSTSPLGLKPGNSLGRYHLQRVLGSGGMATVYLAAQVGEHGFSRQVALKLVHPHLAMQDNFAGWFISEARLGGALHHPNLVATLDFGQIDGLWFMAMEFVDGFTLNSLARSLNDSTAHAHHTIWLQIVIQVCRGLAYAHAAADGEGRPLRIVHRDIKPSNILIDKHGSVKLADFGVARAESNINPTMASGVVKGSLRYLSPEQALAVRDIDGRSDLFSLGLVMLQLFTGRPAYSAETEMMALRMAMDGDVREALEHLPDVRYQASLRRVLKKVLARHKEQRYPSAQAFEDDLQELLEEVGPSPTLGPRWLSRVAMGASLAPHPLERSNTTVEPLSLTRSEPEEGAKPADALPTVTSLGEDSNATILAGEALPHALVRDQPVIDGREGEAPIPIQGTSLWHHPSPILSRRATEAPVGSGECRPPKTPDGKPPVPRSPTAIGSDQAPARPTVLTTERQELLMRRPARSTGAEAVGPAANAVSPDPKAALERSEQTAVEVPTRALLPGPERQTPSPPPRVEQRAVATGHSPMGQPTKSVVAQPDLSDMPEYEDTRISRRSWALAGGGALLCGLLVIACSWLLQTPEVNGEATAHPGVTLPPTPNSGAVGEKTNPPSTPTRVSTPETTQLTDKTSPPVDKLGRIEGTPKPSSARLFVIAEPCTYLEVDGEAHPCPIIELAVTPGPHRVLADFREVPHATVGISSRSVKIEAGKTAYCVLRSDGGGTCKVKPTSADSRSRLLK